MINKLINKVKVKNSFSLKRYLLVTGYQLLVTRHWSRLFLLLLITSHLSLVTAFCAFEQIGAGARPIGMASAFTAISDDAHAIYYNPSGLAQVRRSELTAGYGKLFVGLEDKSNLGSGFVGVVQPLRQGRLGSVGVGWLSLSLDGAYREDLVSFAYGKEVMFNGMFLGGSMKVMKRSFGSDAYTQIDPLFIKQGQDTTDFAFDLGVMYRPSASYSFGFMAKDVNQPDVGLAGGENLPLEIRGGFGYYQSHLVVDGEVSKRDKDVNVSIGFEKYLFKVVGLRGGLSVGSRNRREVATGMSYRGEHFGLDYAFIFPLAGVESTSGSHRFGIVMKFGKAPEKARWEFEEEDERIVEKLLEEKSAKISTLERELESLREQNRSGKLETTWVRQKIEKLEEKLRVQGTKELETMKNRLFESKIESEKMKKKVQEMEERIKRLTEPRKVVVPETPKPEVTTPPMPPQTYVVQDGETLQTIAKKIYEDESKWVEIYEMNMDRVERGGTVRAGQILLLPQK